MKNDQEEFQDYLKAGFKPVQTEDGSYTLKQRGLDEEMHSRGGAVAESFYIYYQALEEFFNSCEKNEEVEVISVGLGMGYNEVLTAQAYIKFGKGLKVTLDSYEKENALGPLFLRRLQDPGKHPEYWASFVKTGVCPLAVKEILESFIELKGSFDDRAVQDLSEAKRIVLFDAYSNKTSQDLWGEDFLSDILKKSFEGSILVTYASTGSLNRALKKNGFVNLKKKGFLYKRESTLAVKKN